MSTDGSVGVGVVVGGGGDLGGIGEVGRVVLARVPRVLPAEVAICLLQPMLGGLSA